MDDGLYTEAVKKHIYNVKARLPADYPLITDTREDVAIVICIPMEHFAWRTVEDRLAIAIEIERLKNLIAGEGIWCLIEKN